MAHTHRGKHAKGENQSTPSPIGSCIVCGTSIFSGGNYVGTVHGLVCSDKDCLIETLEELSYEIRKNR